MEYGLWNLNGGFWTGGSGGFNPAEGISRNFYSSVNNEIEPATFHVTTPGNGDIINPFTTSALVQPCQTNLRTNLEFLSVKTPLQVNTRVPTMGIPVHQDDHLQAVALEVVPMASDLVTEQTSMDSLAPTDSSMPPLMSHQSNPTSNNTTSHNNNNNLTNSNNNINNNNNNITTITNNNNSCSSKGENNNNNNDDDSDHASLGKKDKPKIGRQSNEEVWKDVNGHGTNIKLENNSAVDYLFQQSYQHPMYGMMFARMSNNNNNNNNIKREAGTSDETDEDDEETEGVCPQARLMENIQGTSPTIQNRSPAVASLQNSTSLNLSKNGYECGECGLVAETRPGLKKHIAVCHQTPTTDLRLINALLRKMTTSLTCPITGCRFRSSVKDEMEEHVARHVTGTYKVNGKRRAGPITPQRVRYEREEYRCQICAYSCTVEKAFHKHLKIHSVGRQINQVKISCVICGKDRSSEVDMNKHMKKHRDDRYFCCDICIFKTVQLKKLIQHRRMHTGEKPHLCPHCTYRSARRDNLRSHVRRVHKKDNLFCDTFSPRGLLLTSNSSANTSTVSTPIPTSNQGQPPPPPPPPLVE